MLELSLSVRTLGPSGFIWAGAKDSWQSPQGTLFLLHFLGPLPIPTGSQAVVGQKTIWLPALTPVRGVCSNTTLLGDWELSPTPLPNAVHSHSHSPLFSRGEANLSLLVPDDLQVVYSQMAGVKKSPCSPCPSPAFSKCLIERMSFEEHSHLGPRELGLATSMPPAVLWLAHCSVLIR